MKAKQLPAAILSIKDKGTTGVTISPFQNVRGRSKKEKENKPHCHKKGWGITVTLISGHQHPLQHSCTRTALLLHCYRTAHSSAPRTPTTCMISGTLLNPNEQSRWSTRQPGLPYAWRGSSSPGMCHRADSLSDACWSQAAGLGD